MTQLVLKESLEKCRKNIASHLNVTGMYQKNKTKTKQHLLNTKQDKPTEQKSKQY